MFGNKGEKAAQDVAVSAEIERLISLPVADLAAEMMPAFGPDGPRVPGGGDCLPGDRMSTGQTVWPAD